MASAAPTAVKSVASVMGTNITPKRPLAFRPRWASQHSHQPHAEAKPLEVVTMVPLTLPCSDTPEHHHHLLPLIVAHFNDGTIRVLNVGGGSHQTDEEQEKGHDSSHDETTLALATFSMDDVGGDDTPPPPRHDGSFRDEESMRDVEFFKLPGAGDCGFAAPILRLCGASVNHPPPPKCTAETVVAGMSLKHQPTEFVVEFGYTQLIDEDDKTLLVISLVRLPIATVGEEGKMKLMVVVAAEPEFTQRTVTFEETAAMVRGTQLDVLKQVMGIANDSESRDDEGAASSQKRDNNIRFSLALDNAGPFPSLHSTKKASKQLAPAGCCASWLHSTAPPVSSAPSIGEPPAQCVVSIPITITYGDGSPKTSSFLSGSSSSSFSSSQNRKKEHVGGGDGDEMANYFISPFLENQNTDGGGCDHGCCGSESETVDKVAAILAVSVATGAATLPPVALILLPPGGQLLGITNAGGADGSSVVINNLMVDVAGDPSRPLLGYQAEVTVVTGGKPSSLETAPVSPRHNGFGDLFGGTDSTKSETSMLLSIIVTPFSPSRSQGNDLGIEVGRCEVLHAGQEQQGNCRAVQHQNEQHSKIGVVEVLTVTPKSNAFRSIQNQQHKQPTAFRLGWVDQGNNLMAMTHCVGLNTGAVKFWVQRFAKHLAFTARSESCPPSTVGTFSVPAECMAPIVSISLESTIEPTVRGCGVTSRGLVFVFTIHSCTTSPFGAPPLGQITHILPTHNPHLRRPEWCLASAAQQRRLTSSTFFIGAFDIVREWSLTNNIDGSEQQHQWQHQQWRTSTSASSLWNGKLTAKICMIHATGPLSPTCAKQRHHPQLFNLDVFGTSEEEEEVMKSDCDVSPGPPPPVVNWSKRGTLVNGVFQLFPGDGVEAPSLTTDDQELPQEQLAGFFIEKFLGRGAFGEVVLARYIDTNELFAIKRVELPDIFKAMMLMSPLSPEDGGDSQGRSRQQHQELMNVEAAAASFALSFGVGAAVGNEGVATATTQTLNNPMEDLNLLALDHHCFQDPEQLEFLRALHHEVHVVSSLPPHQHIVKVFGSFTSSTHFNVVIEFAEGGSLDSILAKTYNRLRELPVEHQQQLGGGSNSHALSSNGRKKNHPPTFPSDLSEEEDSSGGGGVDNEWASSGDDDDDFGYDDSGALNAGGGGIVLHEVQLKVWLAQLTAGLVHLHKNGILHRDIKPGNVLLRKKTRENDVCEAVWADFGISAKISDELTSAGATAERTVVGTQAFAPPEVLQRIGGKSLKSSMRSDVWSLGSIFYCLILGLEGLVTCPGELRDVADGAYPSLATLQSGSLVPLSEPQQQQQTSQQTSTTLRLFAERLQRYTPAFLSLIDRMMAPEHRHRPHAKDILKHPSMQPSVPSPQEEPPSMAAWRAVLVDGQLLTRETKGRKQWTDFELHYHVFQRAENVDQAQPCVRPRRVVQQHVLGTVHGHENELLEEQLLQWMVMYEKKDETLPTSCRQQQLPLVLLPHSYHLSQLAYALKEDEGDLDVVHRSSAATFIVEYEVPFSVASSATGSSPPSSLSLSNNLAHPPMYIRLLELPRVCKTLLPSSPFWDSSQKGSLQLLPFLAEFAKLVLLPKLVDAVNYFHQLSRHGTSSTCCLAHGNVVGSNIFVSSAAVRHHLTKMRIRMQTQGVSEAEWEVLTCLEGPAVILGPPRCCDISSSIESEHASTSTTTALDDFKRCRAVVKKMLHSVKKPYSTAPSTLSTKKEPLAQAGDEQHIEPSVVLLRDPSEHVRQNLQEEEEQRYSSCLPALAQGTQQPEEVQHSPRDGGPSSSSCVFFEVG